MNLPHLVIIVKRATGELALIAKAWHRAPQPENAAPDSSDDPLGTSTILPVTPPFPSNSCACLASARGNRCAMSGLIFLLLKEVEQGDQILSKQCRSQPFEHWML